MSRREASILDALTEAADPGDPVAAGAEQAIALRRGRRLTLATSDGDDLVEIRGPAGILELRIRMTPEGPILQMESLRLSLQAAENVNVVCTNFTVHAAEAMTLKSTGALQIAGAGDVHVDAGAEVHVNAALIHLN